MLTASCDMIAFIFAWLVSFTMGTKPEMKCFSSEKSSLTFAIHRIEDIFCIIIAFRYDWNFSWILIWSLAKTFTSCRSRRMNDCLAVVLSVVELSTGVFIVWGGELSLPEKPSVIGRMSIGGRFQRKWVNNKGKYTSQRAWRLARHRFPFNTQKW